MEGVLSGRAVEKMGRRIELFEVAKEMGDVKQEIDGEEEMKAEDAEVQKLKDQVPQLRGL